MLLKFIATMLQIKSQEENRENEQLKINWSYVPMTENVKKNNFQETFTT